MASPCALCLNPGGLGIKWYTYDIRNTTNSREFDQAMSGWPAVRGYRLQVEPVKITIFSHSGTTEGTKKSRICGLSMNNDLLPSDERSFHLEYCHVDGLRSGLVVLRGSSLRWAEKRSIC
ncbi:hypothetical protein RB195_018368 [Necator americanus]|uniref:Uncharacterized protein n=1 Tax=Necator americanus TaxID=51031 RepID=A0ABR1CAY1_NECAM